MSLFILFRSCSYKDIYCCGSQVVDQNWEYGEPQVNNIFTTRTAMSNLQNLGVFGIDQY